MAEQLVSFSRINPINNGVLVCIDEEKKLYKYVPLDQIQMPNGTTLRAFFDNYELKLVEIEKRFKRVENAAGISIDLAVETAEGVSDDL
jgi:hypothetical protein